jgi:hypothetical protein
METLEARTLPATLFQLAEAFVASPEYQERCPGGMAVE